MKKVKVHTVAEPPEDFKEAADHIESIVGELEEWEKELLLAKFDPTRWKYYMIPETYFFTICLEIAYKQTSIDRMVKWLKLQVEMEAPESAFLYSAMLAATCADEHKIDEAALWMNSGNISDLSYTDCYRNYAFDPTGSRAFRHVVRTLLSGSLSKNQDSVLYRSFFRSGLREVHLLPLISKYIHRPYKEYEPLPASDFLELKSDMDVCLLFLNKLTDVKYMQLYLKGKDGPFLILLLPLMIRQCTPRHLYIEAAEYKEELDVSFFQHVDNSKLEVIWFQKLHITSLSPLSLCQFPCLNSIYLDGCYGLESLEGLTRQNTSCLNNLSLSSESLLDISALSDCDLSSLVSLKFSRCPSLSDLSPLRGCDLSSLVVLKLHDCPSLSDLSPLQDCGISALTSLEIFRCPLSDISPLQSMDLSSLQELSLRGCSSLSDLSPLRGLNLSSLKNLDLGGDFSDLSPLYECEGLAVEELSISSPNVDDLSFLLHLDLSRLNEVVRVHQTSISDLSPLESITSDDVQINIFLTPAATTLKEEGVESPQRIGNVLVHFKDMYNN